jgi:hypothetical protein
MTSNDIVPAPIPSLRPLAVLIGRWEMQIRWSAQTHALIGGPATARGVARFEWIEDGRFLVQHQGAAEGPPDARWVVGRDETSEEYEALYADARGVSRVYRMTLVGGTWRIWRNATGFSQRFEGRISGDGRAIEGRWEKSADGATWEHDFDLRYLCLAVSAPPPMRFDVYGRYVLIVERSGTRWRVLQVGDDGKRGLRDDVAIPSELSPDEIAQHLDDLFHESARPGARVRRIE